MTGDPWRDYLAAAQRLDAVRRGAATASAEQDRALRAARDELTGVRARLAPQRARLRELGVPADQLMPAPTEVAAAAQATGRLPGAVLAALRQARGTADAADAVLAGDLMAGRAPAGPWLRNLLVYGPFGTVVFIVQLALYLVVDPASLPFYAVLCGFTMPAVAFGLGWLLIGLAFPPGPGGRVQRTPVVGAVVCFAPVFLLCLGAGVMSLLS